MANDVTTVTVPGVGDIDFPNTMSQEDMKGAINKHFPQVGELRQQAQKNAQARLGLEMSSFGPGGGLMQPPLPAAPAPAPILSRSPNGPTTLDAARVAGQSDWDKTMSMIPQHPGIVPQQDNQVSRFVKKHIVEPQYLPKAIDEAGQIVNALAPGSPIGIDPNKLRIDPNDRAQHIGTQVIPDFLARHQPTEGTLEAPEPWYKAGPRAVGKAAYDVASGLSTPAMMAAAVGMEAAPASPVSKLAGAQFSKEMLQAIPGQVGQSYDYFKHGDIYGGTEAGAQALMGAGFGTLGTAHLLHTEPVHVEAEVKNNPAPVVEAAKEKAATQAAAPQPVEAVDKPVNVTPSTPVKKAVPRMEKPVPPPVPVEPAKPELVEAEPRTPEATPLKEPQAQIPSSPPQSAKLETPMRKLIGGIIGNQRLAESATDRLNVEFAMREIKGSSTETSKEEATPSKLTAEQAAEAEKTSGSKLNQNPLADPNKNFTELDKTRQSMIQSVAKALEVPISSLRSEGWRLSDKQAKQLKSMLGQGLRPFSLKDIDPTHPETAFVDNVHHMLADINVANAKAAGIPDAKNLWDQLTPKEKQERAERKSQQETATRGIRPGGLSPEESTIRQETLGKVAQAAGMTADQLEESLSQPEFRLSKDQLTKIKAAVAKDPSIASALRDLASKQKEGVSVGKQANEAGLESGGKGNITTGGKSVDDLQFEHDMLQNVLKRRLKQAQSALVDRIPAWRQARLAEEGPSKLAQDLSRLEKGSLKGIPKELYADEHLAAKATEAGKASNQPEPVQGTEKAGTTPQPETPKAPDLTKGGESVTMYSNPIVPMLRKMFGFDKPSDVAVLPGPINLRESPIEQLSAGLKNEPVLGVLDQAKAFFGNEGQRVQQTIAEAPRLTRNVFDDLKTGLKNAWDAYATRPGMTALRWAYGKRSLQLQQNAIILHEFHERLNKAFPSHARQEAMVNYLQASGGVMDDRLVNGMLQQKANLFASSSAENARLKQGYIDAQNLTPQEKDFVQQYREYDKHLSDQEEAEGLTMQRRENYIRQIWTRGSLARKVGEAVYNAGAFDVTGNFSKMRVFEDYFEGEQAGLVPQNKSLGYLMEARARASAEVLSNRTMIDELYKSTGTDGKALALPAGAGYSVELNPTAESKKGAILVKSSKPADAVSADGIPYVMIDHPAFQNWKWVGTAADGTQVLYKGNMLVHPEVADQLKRIVQPSEIRKNVIGRTLLKASSVGKQTLLIGLFHPVQLAVHFTEHAAEGGTSWRTMSALNPFKSKPIIDLTDKTQQMLVVHGLKIADFNAESLWDEGVMSRGFASGMPIVGAFWRNMHDSMFQKYIPNMKMAMALDAFDRNMSRYHNQYHAEEIANAGGNVTAEERELASQQAQSRIFRMTSEQMNSAFGGIDWASLPVNKTWQDVARLTVLAPDFLLARMQFAGDAFRPGGWESRKALLVGALVQYTAARAFNSAMNDGDPKWDIHDWNKFIVGKNEYSLRTVQGDMTDALLDTRRFAEHRLNPLIIRPALEAATQKDVYGHPLPPGWQGAGQEMLDFAKNIVPIPAQGLVDALAGKHTSLRGPQNDDRIADSLIQSMIGIRRSKYRTPAERIIQTHFDNLHPSVTPDDQLSMAQKNTFNRLLNEYQKGKMTDDDLENAINDPKANLKQSEIRYLYRVRNETQFKRNARQLPIMDILNAWPKATPAEKFQLAPLIQHKLSTLAPEERDKYQDMLNDYRDTLSDEDSQKISEEIGKDVILENPPAPQEP